ncbi:MAG: hypothetical protein AAGJ73_11750 [Pseudomonadota bacterium]
MSQVHSQIDNWKMTQEASETPSVSRWPIALCWTVWIGASLLLWWFFLSALA